MIGASARPDLGQRSSFNFQPLAWLVGIGAVLVVALGVVYAAIATVIATTPTSATLALPDGSTDLSLGSEVRVNLRGWNAHLENVALFETPIGADGRPGPERPLAVQASAVRESRWPDGSEFSLRAADGPLSADSSYRLTLVGSAITSVVPSPTRTTFEREIRFTTVRSPVPHGPSTPVRLKWEQPLQIQWDQPVEDVRYEITPPTPFRATVDQMNRQVSTVVLENPADGETYKIAVTGARGANGVPLARPADYTVIAPARPRLLEADAERTVEVDKPLTLKFSTPLDRVKLAVEPEVKSTVQIGRDPTTVLVTLDGLAQGTSYQLKVTEAVSRDGAPLTETPTLAFKTPERLMIDTWDPDPEAGRISVKSKPTLTFTQPIRDQRAATAALAIEPAVPGRWQWTDDHTVQFVPTTALPYDAELTIKVKPGQTGARSTAGSYFENEAKLIYTTETDKLIDVDVTKQVMTLYEKGKEIRTFKVATGVPGADTPIGEFNVEYKMQTTRMTGTNVDGSHYDIPDVHWVLAFSGDYTIHGAYWRSVFGRQGSNGCVSLSDDDAKRIFDWAPEGTRVKIHY
ncbi:MAG: L,D-transpeptidase family protein [Chloroflexota bacterium]